MTKWDRLLCPKIHKILEKNKVEAVACIPTWVGGLKFEINCMHGARFLSILPIKHTNVEDKN